jgi:biopolymer transport protein ExbB
MMKICFWGEVAEWSKAHAWKACIRRKRIKGSNPFLSANQFLTLNKIIINQEKKPIMKKLISLFVVAAMLTFAPFTLVVAQETETQANDTEVVEETEATETVLTETEEEFVSEHKSFHQVLKEKFIEGGAGWMTPILICLILGLALVIERILYLNLATTNTKKLLLNLEDTLAAKGVEGAKELCRSTRGPIASIFYQGLDRINENIEIVEKSIVSYGGVQMSRLESNLTWISLFIAVAPMLGFTGTVIGMIQAFDSIEKAGDISPTVVAGGMKVALLTTVFGLITAIILQLLYNYLVAKIETLVNDMEDSSISFMDMVVKYKNQNNI